MTIIDEIAAKYGLGYEEQQLMAIHNLTNDAGTRQGLIDVLEDMQTYISPDGLRLPHGRMQHDRVPSRSR